MARVPKPVARYIKQHFGNHLRELRGSLTLKELEEKANVAAGTLSGIEAGTYQPSLTTMLALQSALELASLEDLVGPVDSPLMPSRRLWLSALGDSTPDK